MGVFRNCDGCHGEIDMSVEKAQPRGREWYHENCNKKYDFWIEARQPIYEEVDKIRDQKLDALRKSIFGDKSTAKLTQEEVEELQRKIREDQKKIDASDKKTKQDQTKINEAKMEAGATA